MAGGVSMDSAPDDQVDDDKPEHALSHLVGKYMEDLLDKLKLLEYENEYVDKMKMESINRYYFQVTTSTGEKFFSFISLAAWLIRKCGKPFKQPREDDDPNSVIATIIETVRGLKAGIECPPNKLKQGHGIHTINVLSFLADCALKKKKFTFVKPIFIEKVEAIPEAGAEICLEKVEEEMFAGFSDDEDEDAPLLSGDLRLSAFQQSKRLSGPDKVLEPDISLDLAAWYAEVERVALSLKVSYQQETTAWRTHLSDAVQCGKAARETLVVAKAAVVALVRDLDFDVERITSKEAHTSARVQSQLAEYKTAKEESSRLKTVLDSANGVANERSAVLYGFQDQIEALKQELDVRGANMTDASQLVEVKRAMANVKNETALMDLRIAVVEHKLLQCRIREKNQLQKALSEAQTKPSPIR